MQLASAYNANIDAGAQSFEKDFLAFVAERQANAGQPDDAYANYRKTYADFAAAIATMSLRASQDPGGMPCAKAMQLARRMGADLRNAPADIDDPRSCASIEVAKVKAQIERLQSVDQQACGPGSTPKDCETVFPAGAIADVLPGGKGQAPLVNATIVTIENLVGFEQDMKPAVRKGG